MDLSELKIMNAAGWCKDIATVRKLAKTQVSDVLVGSITLEERPGNAGRVFWQSPDGTYSLNSLGLPNPGIKKYRKLLPEMKKITDDAGKGLRVSIAGFSPEEYAEMTRIVLPFVEAIELNLGCPNVWGTDGQKPIAAFDLDLMQYIFNRVSAVIDKEGICPYIGVKVSPYSDPQMLNRVIGLIRDNGDLIDHVVTSNTFPNAFGFDGEQTAITPGGGYAGMSGKAMKGIALGQAAKFRTELDPTDFGVIGVGGITCGADILDFMRIGVRRVQIGTHYFLHGEKVFGELLAECAELVG